MVSDIDGGNHSDAEQVERGAFIFPWIPEDHSWAGTPQQALRGIQVCLCRGVCW